MQDLKQHSNRRSTTRKPRTFRRKSRSKPLPVASRTGRSGVKLRKPPVERASVHLRFSRFFSTDNPALLRRKTRWLLQMSLESGGLLFALWLTAGSLWVAQNFFLQPLKEVRVEGNRLLSEAEILGAIGLRPGQRLFDLDPYQLAARLQKHPLVQQADIRRKFPRRIHLILREYRPVALLQAAPDVPLENFRQIGPRQIGPEAPVFYYVLIDRNQRLLKQLSLESLRNSSYKTLPLITGVNVASLRLGTRLDSPVLERGLRFIETFQEMSTARKAETPAAVEKAETQMLLEKQFEIAAESSPPVKIDISDPLNLKMSWPLSLSGHQVGDTIPPRTEPLTVQMGSRNFGERLRTFQAVYPLLDRQHPELKSIDLRYADKVMLVP